MKKFIVTAVAAGALAAGSAASAQDLGSIIGSLFGLGGPTYGYGGSTPAVVGGQIYADQYGRQFYYDQYGRQVYLNNTQHQQIVGYDQWGRPIYISNHNNAAIVGYDQWGRPIYGNSGSYAYGGSVRGSQWDRDGDGIANTRDRWPDDARYR